VASQEAVALIEDAAWSRRHRHLARWRRSFEKRRDRAPLNTLWPRRAG